MPFSTKSTSGRFSAGSARPLIATLVIALTSVAVIHLLSQWHKRRRTRRHSDSLLDTSLEDTFPASDPPASQDFGTPANRG